MKINTEFNIIDYMMLVNEMVEEYFSSDGEYTPHLGELNAMRLFYNKCVTDYELEDEIPRPIDDTLDLEKVVADEQFIANYNKAIKPCISRKLDFSNAYKDAHDIVQYRLSTAATIASSIENSIKEGLSLITEMLSDDTLKSFENIAKEIANGQLTEEAIVNAYDNSNRFSKNTEVLAKTMAEQMKDK